ncbi:hypothetical protein AAFF_G00085350 [Aldrovandia affinis]|uniref:Prolyl 4-hydroxylase subunit alpha-1 n=1 Tax=Aldrovandia affinis TaxID=143900 RepID=A0AAD7RWQ2_9TELE|nr:hypothetical protein AAFF_G00085350 [Aldrovandia affinis]
MILWRHIPILLRLRMELGGVFCTMLLTFLFQSCSAYTDLYTSIGQMTDLLYTEKDLVTSLMDYIQAEENKLKQVKKWAERLDMLTTTATQDPEGFVGHPVNAFKLMKRLNTEWGTLESLVLQDMSNAFISNLTVQRKYFPGDEDQIGAAKALMRLQDTYQLDSNTISTGNLPGVRYKNAMTVDDCYELGKIAYTDADYYHTELWMSQAIKQLEQGEESTVDKATLLDYISYCVYQQGELERALELTKELIKLDPEHQRAKSNRIYFEKQLEKQRGETVREGEARRKEEADARRANDPIPEKKKYEGLCRGEGIKLHFLAQHANNLLPAAVPRSLCLFTALLLVMKRIPAARIHPATSLLMQSNIKTSWTGLGKLARVYSRRQKRLFCRYYDNHRHPRYLLGPVRQEDEWDRPYIVRYHDIISHSEIERVKELAKPRLQRATISNPITGVLETAQYRISKSAWLTYEHPVVATINQRIEDLTGLDMNTAEELQVANYGVGGQYEPHFDFGRKDEPDAFKELGTGNRIATWLFYMSDVAAGGATVFPDVGAVVWPKKGTAVFWYNLFPSGEGDYSTRHAACPVLVGNKWVSNKWIHERGQEFRRRCSLGEEDRGLSPPIPRSLGVINPTHFRL